MGPVHTSPDQALQMHHEIKAATSIAMHFGTFHLADDHQDEPPERITHLIAVAPEPKPNFIVLENGEPTRVE
jgi:L-ascorbate metabolism protein UlaG (beta-lactamase superfamily)